MKKDCRGSLFFTVIYRAICTIFPSTFSFPAQKSSTASGRIFHSALSMMRLWRVSGVSPSSTSTALLRMMRTSVADLVHEMERSRR